MSLLCAISGEAPSNPVASTKSGTVFERRLIEAYIAEHGKDPETGEELTTADLVDLKSSRAVRPRPPELTSIPALLATFQNEWDALALETHSLRQQLVQTRQELSTALYQHDAATRVIARLLRERDEARDALSKVTVTAGSAPATNGAAADSMEVDAPTVPEYIQQKVDATKTELFPTRKKRAVPADWTDAATISQFTTVSTSEPLYAGAKALALDSTGELALVGGGQAGAGIYSLPQKGLVTPLKDEDGAINAVAWAGKRAVTGSGNGVVRVWNEDGSDGTAFTDHGGEVTAVAVHPSGSILASAGVDKSWVMYDLEAGKSVTQIYDENKILAAEFHPDGHLFAAGTPTNVQIYDVRSGTLGATFGPLAGPVSSLNFSENGTWLALSTAGSSTAEIWDLRKMVQTKALDVGTVVEHVAWDYSGQFLATVGPSGVSVQQYAKASKSWSEPLRAAVPAVAAAWGPRASHLVTVDKEGVVSVLAAKSE